MPFGFRNPFSRPKKRISSSKSRTKHSRAGGRETGNTRNVLDSVDNAINRPRRKNARRTPTRTAPTQQRRRRKTRGRSGRGFRS